MTGASVKEVFTQRFKELFKICKIGTYSRFADYLGVSRQSTESWSKPKGKTPDLDRLVLIAKKCNVSTDWLLGITDENIYSANADIRKMHEYTGLSQAAIEALHYFNAPQVKGIFSDDEKANKRTIEMLNHILEEVNERIPYDKLPEVRQTDTILSLMEEFINADEMERVLDAELEPDTIVDTDANGNYSEDIYQEKINFKKRNIILERDRMQILPIADLYKEKILSDIRRELERFSEMTHGDK